MEDTFGILLACGRSAVGRVAGGAGAAGAGATDLSAAANRITCWDAVLDVAEQHGMLPLVASELLRSGDGALPGTVRLQMAAAQREAAARSLAAVRQLAGVVAVLEQAGVAALPYKGPMLALDAFGDVALRAFDDLDIVVQPSDLGAGAAALIGAGYTPRGGREWVTAHSEDRRQGHVTLERGPDDLPVELHWRFCDDKLPWSPDVQGVIARAGRRMTGGRLLRMLRIPSREDQVALVLWHAARHGWDQLEAIVCAAALVARGVDGPALIATARAVGGLRAVLTGLDVVHRLFAVPPPRAAVAAMANDPGIVSLVENAERRLRAGNAGTARDVRLHMALLDGMPARMLYLTRTLLVPKPADLAAIRLPRALSQLYPLVRVVRLAWRAITR